MTTVKVTGGLVIAFALIVVSLPWVLWALGYASIGRDADFERIADRMPFVRWLEWVAR